MKMTGWKNFKGEVLPQKAQEWAERNNIFRSRYGRWIIGYVWYKGKNPETATDWMIVTDDGGYYKVMDDTGWPAVYAFWFPYGPNKPEWAESDVCMHCHWSHGSLMKDVNETKKKLSA